jgi:hypothetical protein
MAEVSYGASGALFELHLEHDQVEPFRLWLAETSNGLLHVEMLGHAHRDVPTLIEE